MKHVPDIEKGTLEHLSFLLSGGVLTRSDWLSMTDEEQEMAARAGNKFLAIKATMLVKCFGGQEGYAKVASILDGGAMIDEYISDQAKDWASCQALEFLGMIKQAEMMT